MTNRTLRLLFLYFFRDFDKGTLDLGLEFTTLRPAGDGKILCEARTLNLKGLREDKFIVDAADRSILNMPGRYICYWISGNRDLAPIYDRMYRKKKDGTYEHASSAARSVIKFDEQGVETSAENLVMRPRRYHEKFFRLLRF